jgi:hypothetical protein
MRKLILFAVLTLSYFFLNTPVWAQQVAGHSAVISYNENTTNTLKDLTIKKIVIRRVLEKFQSPLVSETDSFVNFCHFYQIDCYLLPSITGLESFFGRFTYPNSYNPFGWGGGYIKFENWESGIGTVAKGLKENYYNKGADSVEKIAPIYAESQTWAVRVNYFKSIFQNEEEKVNLLLSKNEVE